MSDEEIDRVAKYLRETLQSGKKLNEWATLPKSSKAKWIALAVGALRAAAGAK